MATLPENITDRRNVLTHLVAVTHGHPCNTTIRDSLCYLNQHEAHQRHFTFGGGE